MKYKTLLTLSSLMLLPVSAVHAETIGDALAKCSKEGNSLQRLVCYDRVVKDINQYSGLEESIRRGYPVPAANAATPATPAKPAMPSAPAAKAENEFGLEHKQPIGDDVDSMSGAISSLDRTLRGKYVITLDNGTVWEQTDSDKLKLKDGETVTIERGILGAFYLTRSDVDRRMKVKRIK